MRVGRRIDRRCCSGGPKCVLTPTFQDRDSVLHSVLAKEYTRPTDREVPMKQ